MKHPPLSPRQMISVVAPQEKRGTDQVLRLLPPQHRVAEAAIAQAVTTALPAASHAATHEQQLGRENNLQHR